MNCPFCGKEMTEGVVQSAREIFFAKKIHRFFFVPNFSENDEISLSWHNFTRPTCLAYHCENCKKVVMDYTVEV